MRKDKDMQASLFGIMQLVLGALIEILMHHVAIGYLLHLVHLLEVPHSRADRAAHREEDAPGANAEGQADDVHVVVETSTDHVLHVHEVLAEELAV